MDTVVAANIVNMWSRFVPDWASVGAAAQYSITVIRTDPTGAPSVFICLILLVSIFFGAKRGLSRELISAAGWIFAPFASMYWQKPFAQWAFPGIQPAMMADLMGFCSVFVIVLVVSSLLSSLFSRMIRKSVLASTDVFLGGVFGALRGSVIVVTLYFVSAWITPGGALLSSLEGDTSTAGLSTALTYLAPLLSRIVPSDLAQQAGTRHDLDGQQDLPDPAHTQNP
ncbi:hypothetical protein GOB93_09725 [Acetobacter musti]|uniref:Colicin V production protein n=1 Tax=Acetobacter musti TaxID=864732 RepID=A0ABX0JSB0_9PROT|nr:CvpA family protein [Acetobacter musti]NHN84918.1 hypothetical protein [Acetobacter musti]